MTVYTKRPLTQLGGAHVERLVIRHPALLMLIAFSTACCYHSYFTNAERSLQLDEEISLSIPFTRWRARFQKLVSCWVLLL